MLTNHWGELAALGTAASFTVCSLAFESASRKIGSLSVNFLRLVLGFVILTVFSYGWRGRWFPGDASLHNWFWLASSGVIGFAIGDQCLFRAFVLIGARIAVLIMSLVPAMTALIGWLVLQETLSLRDGLGMGLTMVGIALVVGQRNPAVRNRQSGRYPLAGLLLAFVGAVCQALNLVLSKLGMGDYDPFAATQIRIIAGTLGLAVYFGALGGWTKVSAALSNGRAMGILAAGAFFGPFLGVSLSLVAIRYTQAGVAATLMGLIPVLIIPPAILIKKETVTAMEIVGALVAVAGSAVLFL